ncbi:MAG TPA: hypothetical protein PKA56_10795 [Solirubrobacterales bacterium]|jgi:hypothetical protein|nr:hypothetical protein [Solirubrobacterales bacterium]HMU26453.1 hypothetical protein [Solirubrobacterales bacterium]HMX72227.1 hypothetical protein [Solirubrobacterales bacterium]HMY25155.1 hypothetical protein [Solirubrobacterales bacterium]HNA24615.1 hypothetical protein [Solirubrobacterales bacterium]
MSVRIELMPDPVRHGLARTGGVTCEQEAVITVDRETFEQIWTPSTLELLARSYWDYIRRFTLGAIRVQYRVDSQTVTLLGRVPLLRFRTPVFSTGNDRASIEWPVEKGLLVARDGRGKGFLRIEASRGQAEDAGCPTLMVSSTVSNFYPWLRGTGRFARFGTWLYSQTQLRIHILVTKGFLRSLDELPDEVLRRGVSPGTG